MAQFVEWSLQGPEVHSSNPVTDEDKEKEGRGWPILKETL